MNFLSSMAGRLITVTKQKDGQEMVPLQKYQELLKALGQKDHYIFQLQNENSKLQKLVAEADPIGKLVREIVDKLKQ